MFGLVPFRKSSDIMDFRKVMDNFFEDSGFLGVAQGTNHFRVDVKDDKNQYLVEAELPGVDKEKIDLKVEDDVLTISVKSSNERSEERGNYIRRERSEGSYCRAFRLDGIKNDSVTANYKDGILTVVLPKDETERVRARSIEIQ